MKAEDILHVVPVKEYVHTLYLRDGRIISIATTNGNILTFATLPSDEDLEKAAKEYGKSGTATPLPFHMG